MQILLGNLVGHPYEGDRGYRKKCTNSTKWAKIAIPPDDPYFFFVTNVRWKDIYHIQEKYLEPFFVKKSSLISTHIHVHIGRFTKIGHNTRDNQERIRFTLVELFILSQGLPHVLHYYILKNFENKISI